MKPPEGGALGGATADKARAFWTRVEQVGRAAAQALIDDAIKNLRPGGLTPVAVTIAQPVADAVTPAAHIDIPFPGSIQSFTFRSTVEGSATVDIWVRRPTQLAPAAASIMPLGTFPVIVGATDAVIFPSPDWITFIEAGSTVYYYLIDCSGFDSLTLNLWLHCT